MTDNRLIQGTNKYCGPTVLAAISGKTTNECARLVQRPGRKRKELYGMRFHEMDKALKLLHIKARTAKDNDKWWPANKCLTLKNWMDQCRRPSECDGFAIVCVTWHYVLVHGNQVFDTMAKCQWRNIDDHPCKQRKVRGVWFLKDIPNKSIAYDTCENNDLQNGALLPESDQV